MAVFLQPLGAFFRLTPLRNEWQNVELNAPLDDLYLNGDKSAFKNALKSFKKNGGLKGYQLASHESIDKVMEDIARHKDGVSPLLYNSYFENLNEAINHIFGKNNDSEIKHKLQINVSKFAAFKAYNATIEVQSEMGNDLDEAERVLRKYNRHQITEYNTTISRCRTAKQFEKFNAPGNDVPNLRWLPSRSVDPRESHKFFWDRVWAKGDPFWMDNTPGSLWNCKCDLEETYDPVTPNNPTNNVSVAGLHGNPHVTGEVFTTIATTKKNKSRGYEPHPYFLNNYEVAEEKASTLYFKDNKSDLAISSIADKNEIHENIITGRLLSKHAEVKIRPDFSQKFGPKKNPEFLIDGMIADAKRLQSSIGISNGFTSALKQGCEVVVFDFDYNKSKIDINIVARGIVNRWMNFKDKTFNCCYIQHNGEIIKINGSLFDNYNNEKEERFLQIDRIEEIIKKAMK